MRITDKSAMITRYVGSGVSLAIPETTVIGGEECSVNEVGDGAFFDCESLLSVTVPASVKFIGGAFNKNQQITVIYCEARREPENWSRGWNSGHPTYWNVKSADIANDGSGAYYLRVQSGRATVTRFTGSAASFDIPAEVTIGGVRQRVTAIGDGAFYGRSSLAKVAISDNVRTIGDRAFWGCSALSGIVIPRRVTAIGDSAFYACSSLEEVEIPYGANQIGKLAFAACTSLRRVSIPASVRSIGERAFTGCRSLSIYCEARSVPNGWSSDWNPDERPTVWRVPRGDLSSIGREPEREAVSSGDYSILAWESFLKRDDVNNNARPRYRNWGRGL
jgi:hypothetical protein